MSLAVFKALYANASSRNSGYKQPYDKQDATMYWLKHKVNLLGLNKLLLKSTFEERYVIMDMMSVAERKVAHWERHRNFDMQRALTVFSAVKRSG